MFRTPGIARARDYDYLGTGWYFQRFELPKLPVDAIVQLHFGATFYKARVWVNGVEVGGHEGGYTEYSFDITPHLHASNLIAVAIDNRPGMFTIPGFGARGAPDAWYDWWAYGGIVRDVWLSVHGPVRIERQLIRSKLEGGTATVTDRVSLTSSGVLNGKLRAMVIDPAGVAHLTHVAPVALKAGHNEIPLTIRLRDIQRWDLDHPNLYRVITEIVDSAGKSIEISEDTFGLREIEIRDRHLLINGQRVRLTGMTRHADSPWEGLAETEGTLGHDWEDMKSLNMTLTRPVHYAPDPWAAKFADKRGILLMPEIPVWQASEEQLSNPRYLELAKRQMRELIEQYGNHPSCVRVERVQRERGRLAGRHQVLPRDARLHPEHRPGTLRHDGRRQSAETQAGLRVRCQRRGLPHDEPVLRRLAWATRSARSRARQGESALPRQNGDHL
jgi:beta-glucuronidase